MHCKAIPYSAYISYHTSGKRWNVRIRTLAAAMVNLGLYASDAGGKDRNVRIRNPAALYHIYCT